MIHPDPRVPVVSSLDDAPRNGTEFIARVMDRFPFSAAPEYRWDIAHWSGKTPNDPIGHFASRSGSLVIAWASLPETENGK
jgi:hypothetical protein